MTALGMLGLGVISTYYLDALPVGGLALAGVFDPADERVERAALDGSVERFSSASALLGSPTIDAVVLNVPNDLHHELAREALLAGKHVCVEKPLTLDVASAEELQRLARREGLVLEVAFHRRFNRHLRELEQVVEARTARGDRVVRCLAAYNEDIREHAGDDSWYLDPVRCGGGAIADNGPNVFDTVRHLLGDLRLETVEVIHERDGVDLSSRLAGEAGGVPVEIELDWAYPRGELKNVVLEWDDGTRTVCDYLAGYPAFKSSLYHEYRGVLERFARLLAGPGATEEDGVAAVRLVAEAYRLSRTMKGADR